MNDLATVPFLFIDRALSWAAPRLGLGLSGQEALAGHVIVHRQGLGGSLQPPLGPVASMSFPRCALLWARLPAGRRVGHRAAACSALRARVEPLPGALGRVSAVASASSSSASGGSKAPNTSLFVPLTVKPQGPSADGDVGAELTRPLDKSECGARRGAWPRGSCTTFPWSPQVPSRVAVVPARVCLPRWFVSPPRLGTASCLSFHALPQEWSFSLSRLPF